jgi:hypothetical protein
MQVIVTCRTEYLSIKGAYQSLFVPVDARGVKTSDQLQELFVRPFQKSQRSEYFDRWVAERKKRPVDVSGSQPSSKWSRDDYMYHIRTVPGLKSLAQTPFALRVLADALPRLFPKHKSGVVGPGREVPEQSILKPTTRAMVYSSFMEECWEESERRRRRAPIPGLPASFDGPTSYNNYCQDLAVSMFVKKQVGTGSARMALLHDALRISTAPTPCMFLLRAVTCTPSACVLFIAMWRAAGCGVDSGTVHSWWRGSWALGPILCAGPRDAGSTARCQPQMQRSAVLVCSQEPP